MGKEKVAMPGAQADQERAIPGAEAAEALAEAMAQAEAAAAAAANARAIVPSPVPINICGLREAQILAVKLAPGALVKVCNIAAKDATALALLLERQRERSGWKVAPEDLRALEFLAVAYLQVCIGIDALHPIMANSLSSTNKHKYLEALKDWSLLFEDVAARVPSVGAFKFSAEARNICKLARKVAVRGHNGAPLRDRLDKIGEGLRTLLTCSVNFPTTLKKMRAKEKGVAEAERKRREKAEERVAAAIAADAAIPGGAAIIPDGAAAIPEGVVAPVATEIWGLRAAYALSATLVHGSMVKVRSVKPKHALALYMLLGSQHEQGRWRAVDLDDELRQVRSIDDLYHLLNTALEAHVAVFSTLPRHELAGNAGYVIAFSDWVSEFEDTAVRASSLEGAVAFRVKAAELCKCVREMLVEAVNCNRSQLWFAEKLSMIRDDGDSNEYHCLPLRSSRRRVDETRQDC